LKFKVRNKFENTKIGFISDNQYGSSTFTRLERNVELSFIFETLKL